jgi:outer membrane protein assembly factor BamB
VSLGFFGGAAACGRRLVMASDRVRCLDLRDGSTIWEADPLRGPSDDDYFWGPPVIVAGRVLLGSGAGSEATATRGRVSAYDLRDGTLVWSTPLVAEGANGGGVLAPVTVDLATGSVWAATGAPYIPTPEPVPGASALVELSLRSGRVRWQDDVHPGDIQGLDLNSAPVLDGSTIGLTGKDGVWAWDRRTRQRRWHVQLTPATPSGGGTAGPTNGPEGGPIASDDGRFLVLSNDEDRGVSVAASLDRRRGRVRWHSDLGGFTFAAPAVADGLLFAATASGDLEVLRARDGSSVARVPLGVPSAGAVAIGERRLLVGVGAEPFLPGGELVCVG